MREEFKTYFHAPTHLFRPNAKYFITGSTYQRKPYFRDAKLKQGVLKYMFKSFEHFGWKIEDWVLLDNHYHLMADAPEDASTLSRVIKNFHQFSALWLKKNTADFKNIHKIWYNYWDKCITYEKSYFVRINYIWFNPVKHGYVEDAKLWKFGSFYQRSKEWRDVKGIVEKFPFDKISVEDDF